MSKKLFIAVEVLVDDDQDIDEYMSIMVEDHFNISGCETTWITNNPLIQMVRSLRDYCPMVDGIELFVDTDYERKIMWNPNMNNGEYEVFTRQSEDGFNEEWTEYTSYSPDDIDTLIADQMEAQEDLRRDIAERDIIDEIERNK